MEFLIMSAKLRASSEAPPTSAPSTSGWLISSLALVGLHAAAVLDADFFGHGFIEHLHQQLADEGVRVLGLRVVAVLPVPMAQTGS